MRNYDAANALLNFTARFGQVNAPVGNVGLAAGFVGLYPFNITVPAGVTGGPSSPQRKLWGPASKSGPCLLVPSCADEVEQ